VQLIHRSYPRLGEGEAQALEQALADDIQGLVIAPGRADELAPLMRQAAERGIPVVCVNTEAPSAPHLATVCVDGVVSGAVVGELMARFLGGRGRLVVVTGQLNTIDHAQKLQGLENVIREFWPALEIAAVVEAHDDETEAYQKCREALASAPDAAGLYVSTANSVPVMKALEDHGSSGRITVITTDLFPALARFIESGTVAATIYQRPLVQGQIAFQTISKFLVDGVTPSPVIRLSPHILMRSNLKLFLQRMGSDPAKSGGPKQRHRHGAGATYADEIT
jgi:LacI family transcriptional regulator